MNQQLSHHLYGDNNEDSDESIIDDLIDEEDGDVQQQPTSTAASHLSKLDQSLSQLNESRRFSKKRKLSEFESEDLESEVYKLKRKNEILQQEAEYAIVRASEFEIQYKKEKQRRLRLRESYDVIYTKAKEFQQELATLRNEQLNSSKYHLDHIEELSASFTTSKGNDSFEVRDQSVIEKKLFESEDKSAKLEGQIGQLNLHIDHLRNDNRSLTKEISEFNTKLEISREKEKQSSQQLREALLKLEEATALNQLLERKLSGSGDVETELKFLKGELQQLQVLEMRNKELQTKNQELNAKIENELLLKEEISDLKRELQRVGELEIENHNLRGKVRGVEQSLIKWEESFSGKSPGEVVHELKSLTTLVSRLNAEVDELKAAVRIAELEAKTLEQEREYIHSKLSSKQEEMSNTEQKLREAELKVHSLTQENKSHKQLLASYDQEDAMRDEGKEDKLNRVAELEKILAQRDAMLKEQSDRINALVKQNSEYVKEKDGQNMELEKLRKQTSAHESEMDKLKQEKESLVEERARMEKEIADYERRIGRGEYNRETMKVLHLAINPETMAKAQNSKNELESLRAENTILKDKLEKYEQEVGGDAANTKELKEKIFQLEKMNTRLKEAFQQQIKKFRAGIYRLFGWRVDIMSDNFRLSSMYAERQEDYLLFKESESGMELMESEYASQIEAHLLEYLSTYDSIPLFLSKVTNELFQKQTHVSGLKLLSIPGM